MNRLVSRPALAVFLLLLAVMVSFWYFALVRPADRSPVTLESVDIYHQHYPIAKYAGELLAEGRLPLWNPYQLTGMPFLAVPLTRLFYPPNLIYLWSNTGVAIEVDLVFHWLFAGVGLWLLVRIWGMSHLAGFAAATSFMLSQSLIASIQWPGIVACLAWLPWTILTIELTFRGKEWAPIAVALSLAVQIFNGATEMVIYNGYASALYVICRSVQLLRARETRRLARQSALLLGAVIAGVGLTAIQLLPTLELVSQTERGAGGNSLAYALGGWPGAGYLPPRLFLLDMLSGNGRAAMGVLPLLGLFFYPRDRTARLPWFFAVSLGVCAMFLIFGGPVFELYHHTPFGQIFRRPSKFFYLYSFAQGILAAYAITALLRLRDQSAMPFKLQVGNASGLAAGIASLGWVAWLVWTDTPKPWILVSIGLFIVFALVKNRSLRTLACIALCAAQLGNLFAVPRNPSMRPFRQEHLFDRIADLLNELRDSAPNQRIYPSRRFIFDPAFAAKQGLLRRAYFATDYEPLVTTRHANYFQRASGELSTSGYFKGGYVLGENTRWRLLDQASVRYYLTLPLEAQFNQLRLLAELSPNTGIRHRREHGFDVIERTQSLPRAYFVSNARAFDDPDDILDALDAPKFRERREVLLEKSQDAVTTWNRKPKKVSVHLSTPDPETVIVKISTDQRGYVVLTDAWYPGWQVTVNGRESKLYRANYLFRAVGVDAGESTVAFRYRPESFYWGARISGVFALAILLASAWIWRAAGPRWDLT